MITISVTPGTAELLRRPLEGEGGFQDLLRKLQSQLDLENMSLLVDSSDLERIPRYENYKPGGYEDRLVPLSRPLEN